MAPGVVVVGASAAGFNAAETLRREGHAGPITLLGDEPRLPYDRPSVSKRLLQGAAEPSDVALCDEERLAALGIDYRPGVRATALDVSRRSVRIEDDGARGELGYETLVIATGARARAWSGPGGSLVRTLRTADDALALRTALSGAERVHVIGAGILGCEIASAARAAGRAVTLTGRGGRIGFGGLGHRLSTEVEALLVSHDVDLRLGCDVTAVAADRSRHVAALSDGTSLSADLVVAAIGAAPAVDWLAGSGLAIDDGVVCDEHGQAAPGVFAVGDVARWRDPATGATVRVEHQMSAIEQGQAVGRHLAGGEAPRMPSPFYWSELFGTRVTVQGRFTSPEPLDVIAGSLGEGRFLAASRRDGELEGAVSWNMPREFRALRAELLRAAAPQRIATPI